MNLFGKSIRLNIPLKRSLLIAGVAVVVCSAIPIFFLDSGPPDSGPRPEPVLPTGGDQALQALIDTKSIRTVEIAAPEQQARAEFPIRLKIPKIRVDAAVKPVGLTPEGAMDAPKVPADAAWLSLGPRPGEKGAAVISGHYGWKNNIPAAFDNLHTLQKGDRVYVEDGKGGSISFVVREIRTYGEQEDASEVFASSDGKVRLNLITCKGTWDKARKSYSDRLVVFTEKE